MSTGTALKSELAAQYKILCNDELLAVAAQRSALTIDAQMLLAEEMLLRGLSEKDLDAYLAALDQQEPEMSVYDEYVERFAACTRDELQRIAHEPLTLTPEMRDALVAEFDHREIPLPDGLRGDAKLAAERP